MGPTTRSEMKSLLGTNPRCLAGNKSAGFTSKSTIGQNNSPLKRDKMKVDFAKEEGKRHLEQCADGKSWYQTLRAADDIASAFRMQGMMNTGA